MFPCRTFFTKTINKVETVKFILSPAGQYEYTKIRFFVAESRIKIVKLTSVKIP